MNKQQRKLIADAIVHLRAAQAALDMAKDIIESVKSEEEDKQQNLPDNLQGSERAEKLDEAVNTLENAVALCDDCNIEDTITELEGL